jgi:hypothetical protein
MSVTQISLDEHSVRLRTAYDKAFAMWVKQVTSLQGTASDPNATPAAIDRARFQCRLAELAYRERRDRLWNYLAGCDHQAPPMASNRLRAAS